MSEPNSSESVQQRRDQNPPWMAGFLVLAFTLVLGAGAFGIWRYQVREQTASEAARLARLRAEEAKLQSQLAPYKVNPNTGELTKTNGVPENLWPAEGVADFNLIDQTGKEVSKEDLLGKPWAVCFVFTRCASHCLRIMAGMQELDRELQGTDVRLVTITVDPEYDTPQVLSHYAAGFKADPKRWLFLTGEQQEIYPLIKDSFLLQVHETTGPDRKPGYEVDHTKEIVHVNAQGQVVGQYDGLEERDRRKLAAALKQEAEELKNNPSDLPHPPDIGDFELTERSGKKVTNKDLLGQPWAVCFVFTRCAGPCLDITTKMAGLHSALKDQPVRLVTITVDPTYDTPEVLKNYADNFGADPNRWLFLTGEEDYVYQLLRGYFRQIVHQNTGKTRERGWEVFHTTDVLHIDARGNIVKRYHGNDDAEMAKLRRALLDEAKHLAENPLPQQSPKTNPPAVAEKPDQTSEGEH